MATRTEDTLLFALIETGALARQSALAPLRELGLAPGDDAVLLWLNGTPETEFSEMKFELGLDPQTLRSILFRFQNTGLVRCTPIRDGDDIEVNLTEGGTRLVKALDDHWQALDRKIRENLSKKKAKKLLNRLHEIADDF